MNTQCTHTGSYTHKTVVMTIQQKQTQQRLDMELIRLIKEMFPNDARLLFLAKEKLALMLTS